MAVRVHDKDTLIMHVDVTYTHLLKNVNTRCGFGDAMWGPQEL